MKTCPHNLMLRNGGVSCELPEGHPGKHRRDNDFIWSTGERKDADWYDYYLPDDPQNHQET